MRVRIAVVIDNRGRYMAMGASSGWDVSGPATSEESMGEIVDIAKDCGGYLSLNTHWVEVDLPLPEVMTFQGEVVEP